MSNLTKDQRSERIAMALAAIVESSDDAIIEKTLDGTITSWNPGAERIFGYAASEMINASITKIIPLERQAEETTILAQVARGERVRHFETVRRSKDGRLVDISVTASPIKDGGGRVVSVSKIARDISGRKLAEEAVRASEAKLREVINGLGPYMFAGLMTPDGVLIEANQPALAAAGLKPEDVLGRPFEETYWWAYSKPVQQQLRAAIARALAGEICRYDVQVRVAEDALIWIDFSLHPVHDLCGQVIYLVPSANVINERKEAEKELRSLVGRLNCAREEEAKRIARDIHDDLGQHLAVLKMELDELERNQPGATVRQRDQFARIHEIVDHTVEAVQRIAANLRLGPLDVFGLTAAIDWQLKEFSRRSAIPCQITRLDEIANLSDTQNTAIFRILQEALTNIVRHAAATEIDVSLEAAPDQLTLQVHDNGRGITAAEVSDRTAIGLLGMRERASLVGGDVTITGGPGMGTTVLVRMPLNQTGTSPP